MHGPVAPADFYDWRRDNRTFSVMAAVEPAAINISGDVERVIRGAEIAAVRAKITSGDGHRVVVADAEIRPGLKCELLVNRSWLVVDIDRGRLGHLAGKPNGQ